MFPKWPELDIQRSHLYKMERYNIINLRKTMSAHYIYLINLVRNR